MVAYKFTRFESIWL